MFAVQQLVCSVYENMTTWVRPEDNEDTSSGTNVDGEIATYNGTPTELTDESESSENEAAKDTKPEMRPASAEDTDDSSISQELQGRNSGAMLNISSPCSAENESENVENSFAFTFETSIEETSVDDNNETKLNQTNNEDENEITCEAVFILDGFSANNKSQDVTDTLGPLHHELSKNLEVNLAKSQEEQDNTKLVNPEDVNQGGTTVNTYICESRTTEKHSWTEEQLSDQVDGFVPNTSDDLCAQVIHHGEVLNPCSQSSDNISPDTSGKIATRNVENITDNATVTSNTASPQTLLMETAFSGDSTAQAMAHSQTNLSHNKTEISSAKSVDSEFARLTSTIERKYNLNSVKMEPSAKSKDKFKVSFNSDTSDSEDSDITAKAKEQSPQQNGTAKQALPDKSPEEVPEKSKKKKKEKEKTENDKSTKKSKKSDKKSEESVEINENRDKKSKSDKSQKKEKKSEKKEKKAKTDKENSDVKAEKKEKKEKKSKSKESKKKSEDSDTSVSCNGDISEKIVNEEIAQNDSQSKSIDCDVTIELSFNKDIQNTEGTVDISSDTQKSDATPDTDKSGSTCVNGVAEDIRDIETTESNLDISISKDTQKDILDTQKQTDTHEQQVTLSNAETANNELASAGAETIQTETQISLKDSEVTIEESVLENNVDEKAEEVNIVLDIPSETQSNAPPVKEQSEDTCSAGVTDETKATTENDDVVKTNENEVDTVLLQEKENVEGKVSVIIETSEAEKDTHETDENDSVGTLSERKENTEGSVSVVVSTSLQNDVSAGAKADVILQENVTPIADTNVTPIADKNMTPIADKNVTPVADKNDALDNAPAEDTKADSRERSEACVKEKVSPEVSDIREPSSPGNEPSNTKDEQVTGDSNQSVWRVTEHEEVSQGNSAKQFIHEKMLTPHNQPDVQQESNNIVSTFSHQDLLAGQITRVNTEQQNEGNCGVSTPETSAVHRPNSDQNTYQETEQNTSKTWSDYASHNIKSIYFSDEFQQQSNMADKVTENGEKLLNDIELDKQTTPEQNKTSKDEKYNKILLEAKASQQMNHNGEVQEAVSSVSNFSEASTRKTMKTFSQDSYEAAVNRAFASASREDRSPTDIKLSSPGKENDFMSEERISLSESATKSEQREPVSNTFSDYRSDLRMSSDEDGRDALERTTTFLAGDRQSTDELIKRILAESRGETWTGRSDRDRRVHSVTEDNVVSHERDENRVPADMDGYMHNRDDYMHNRMRNASGDQAELRTEEVSDIRRPEPRRGMYVREEFEDMQMRSSQSPSNYMGGAHHEGADSQRHKYRSGFMQKQAAIYDDYAESFKTAANRYAHDLEDDDDDRYSSSRRRQMGDDVIYIPDEDFIPKKAEDTDEVVQERTAEIRNVVDNQNEVLTRLKSASDSFDELQDEIKHIKQQFLESSMRRSIILDDIEYEREQMEYEMAQASGYPHAPGRQYGALRRSARARAVEYDDEDFDVSSQYRPQYNTTQSGAKLDKELESDSIASGALQNLAIVAGSSAIGTRDDLDTEQKYGAGRSYSSYAASVAKRGRSASMFEDNDFGYDMSGSVRPKLSSRFTANGLGGDEDDDDAESYRSPNLPSYRRYDTYGSDRGDTSYGVSARDYTTSYSGRYNADAGRYDDGASSASGDSGRYGHRSLLRSQTLDSYSYERSSTRNKYSSPAPSTFSSKFLDKVREKKAAGEDVKRDKPFTSRFLSSKTTFEGPYSKKNYSSSFSSTRSEETSTSRTTEKTEANAGAAES